MLLISGDVEGESHLRTVGIGLHPLEDVFPLIVVLLRDFLR